MGDSILLTNETIGSSLPLPSLLASSKKSWGNKVWLRSVGRFTLVAFFGVRLVEEVDVLFTDWVDKESRSSLFS